MAVVGSATPLIALDAVVIDSETTSLDPAKARIVEIAAVRLAAGRVDSADAFRRLVRPDEPIPAAAIAIHHIDDGKVADAPPSTQVWPELLAFMGEAVLIGHSLGFDLAVLKRECERAGYCHSSPRARSIPGCSPRSSSPISRASRSRDCHPGSVSRSRTAIRRSATRSRRRTSSPRSCRGCARRYPHAGGGDGGLSDAHRRARPAASRGLARGAGAHRWRAHPEPHRQLSLSSSCARRDAVAGEIRPAPARPLAMRWHG